MCSASPPASPKPPNHRKSASTPEKLPSLNRMQAVALVAVDAEREKLRVRQLATADQQNKKVKGQRVMQRSKSLMNVR